MCESELCRLPASQTTHQTGAFAVEKVSCVDKLIGIASSDWETDICDVFGEHRRHHIERRRREDAQRHRRAAGQLDLDDTIAAFVRRRGCNVELIIELPGAVGGAG